MLFLPIMRILTIGVVLSLTACSSSDESELCDVLHRDGTYVQSFSERDGGTCGELQDQVVILDAEAMTANSGIPIDCALDSQDEVSNDQCKVTRAYTCSSGDSTASVVATSTESERGDTLTGVFTITAFDETGAVTCRSTYDSTYRRQ